MPAEAANSICRTSPHEVDVLECIDANFDYATGSREVEHCSKAGLKPQISLIVTIGLSPYFLRTTLVPEAQ